MDALTACIAIFWQAGNIISKYQAISILEWAFIEVEGKSDNWCFSPVLVWGGYDSKIRTYKNISAWNITMYKTANKNEQFELGDLPLIGTYVEKFSGFIKNVFGNFKLSYF